MSRKGSLFPLAVIIVFVFTIVHPAKHSASIKVPLETLS